MNKQTLFATALFMSVAAGIFGTIPGLPLRVAQEVLGACGILTILSLFYVKNWWLKLFGLWNVIRTVMGLNEPAAFSLYTTIMVLFLYQFIVDTMNDDATENILNVVCLLLIFQSLMIICQFCGLWIAYTPLRGNVPDEWIHFNIKYFVISATQYPMFSDKWMELIKGGSIGGTSGNINIASTMLGVGIVAFFRRGWVKLLPLIIVSLLIVHALTGILTAAVISCAYIVLNFNIKKAAYGILAITASIGIFFYFHEDINNVLNLSARLPAWTTYIKEIIPLRLWEGWGVGQAPFVAQIVNIHTQGELWRHPHNEYINILLEVGIIGSAFALGYIVTIMAHGFKTAFKDNTSMIVFLGSVGCLFSALASFNFHVTAGFVGLIFLALLEYKNKRRLEDEKYNHVRNSICYPGNLPG